MNTGQLPQYNFGSSIPQNNNNFGAFPQPQFNNNLMGGTNFNIGN